MESRAENQSGFTYIWVLIAVALIGVGLAATAELWTATQRAREREELLWVGSQWIQALDSYYEASPGVVVKSYPKDIQELLEDRRLAVTRRHLRKLYIPFGNVHRNWRLLRTVDSQIVGVEIAPISDNETEWLTFSATRVAR